LLLNISSSKVTVSPTFAEVGITVFDSSKSAFAFISISTVSETGGQTPFITVH